MSDNLADRGPRDASRVALNEDWEVSYWTKALGVDERRLKELVKLHGNSVEAIRTALRK